MVSEDSSAKTACEDRIAVSEKMARIETISQIALLRKYFMGLL